jgi:TolA-binding protein
MDRWTRMSAVTACFTLALACEQQTEVQRQTRDLQEAQKNVGKVTRELEQQLANARADVARLEEKVALARQGLTDDVLENQKELTAALKAQEHKVQSELGEAKREAEIHGRDTEAALKQLGQTGSPATPNDAPPPGDPARAAQAPADSLDRNEFVPVKGGPDPAPEGSVDIQPGTPEPEPPQTPPAAVTPNDPPAPMPTPPAGTSLPENTSPPSDTPPGNAPPSDTPPGNAPPSDTPPGN